jgi:hypothetical protein
MKQSDLYRQNADHCMDIKPGAIVFVPTIRQSDGSLTSGAVLFGKDGVIPPM